MKPNMEVQPRHDSHLGPPLNNLKGCYILKFSKPFASYGTWNKGSITEKQTEAGANQMKDLPKAAVGHTGFA